MNYQIIITTLLIMYALVMFIKATSSPTKVIEHSIEFRVFSTITKTIIFLTLITIIIMLCNGSITVIYK